ncbi:hypothetical protein, partial [Desulfobacula sp.]|uniref:hypothetical protein n=1 Tax=Desulfobacula sp. TaxID=2593537 RepID=UPI00261632D6
HRRASQGSELKKRKTAPESAPPRKKFPDFTFGGVYKKLGGGFGISSTIFIYFQNMIRTP